jgi:hypothetical protein
MFGETPATDVGKSKRYRVAISNDYSPLPWGEGGPRPALSRAGAGRMRGQFVARVKSSARAGEVTPHPPSYVGHPLLSGEGYNLNSALCTSLLRAHHLDRIRLGHLLDLHKLIAVDDNPHNICSGRSNGEGPVGVDRVSVRDGLVRCLSAG